MPAADYDHSTAGYLTRAVLIMCVALMVMVGALAIAGVLTVHSFDSQQSQVSRQQSTLVQNSLHACEATNVQRALDNASHWADYRYDTGQIQGTTTTLHAFLLALQRIGVSKALLDQAATNAARQLADEKAVVATKTWSALTDCAATQAATTIEVFPLSQGAPPATAMNLQNAVRPDPAGSTH